MTTTTYKGIYLPVVSGDTNVWGTDLNTNSFPVIDKALGGISTLTITGSTYSMSAAESGTALVRITGTLSANCAITTSCQGFTFFENVTSGAYTVTVTNGVGTAITLPQGAVTLVISDATNGCRYGSLPQFNAAWLSNVAQSVTASSSSLSINMSLGWCVNLTLNANVTSVAFTNWPAANVLGVAVLDITSTGNYTMSGWPATTLWTGGTAPTVTPSGKDTLILHSSDGGSNFRGFRSGAAMA
jgi:hypothetical protein